MVDSTSESPLPAISYVEPARTSGKLRTMAGTVESQKNHKSVFVANFDNVDVTIKKDALVGYASPCEIIQEKNRYAISYKEHIEAYK